MCNTHSFMFHSCGEIFSFDSLYFIRRCFSVNTVVLIVTNVCKEKLEILVKNCYCWK
jgi:hypothetical protein